MTDLNDILISGKARNPDANASTLDAHTMENYFRELFVGTSCTVGDIVINTTVEGWEEAKLIPLQEVEPQPDDDQKFFYHLTVSNSATGQQILWHVASWLTAVEVRNIEVATRDYLTELDPDATYLTTPYTYDAIKESLNQLYAFSGAK